MPACGRLEALSRPASSPLRALAVLIDAALRRLAAGPERLTCPVLFAGGPTTTAAVAVGRAATGTSLPHADWVEIDGAGHHPQVDRPLEAAELIRGWTG